MRPAQAGKPRVIAIRRDPFTARLDGQQGRLHQRAPLLCSMDPSREAVSSRSIPGRTPLPRTVVSLTGPARLLAFRRLSTPRSASSMTEVRVRPDSAASFFASANTASSSRTVVRMHQDISIEHKYVKQEPILVRRALCRHAIVELTNREAVPASGPTLPRCIGATLGTG